MMMQCPRCSTRWRVAAGSPVENPLFKCGRCHHLFRQFPGATPPSESATPSRRTSAAVAPDTLEFIFPDRQPAELLVPAERRVAPAPLTSAPAPDPIIVRTPPSAVDDTVVVPAPLDRYSETSLLGRDVGVLADDVGVPAHNGHEHELGLDDDPVDDPPLIDHLADDLADDAADDDAGHELGSDLLAEPAADAELELDDLDATEDEEAAAEQPTIATDSRRVVRVEEHMKVPAGFSTIVRALGVAVSGFAALALVVRVAPEQTSAWLARLPVAGSGFAHDRNLTSKVELKNVQGRFERLRNARRVFVISGDARNNSPMTIERIEVAGALYGLGGGELDQKVVTTGNRTTLTDLSEAEIALLQRLDPVIALAPGDTTPFLIVFLEPPRELREFSSRVLSARPTRRASTPPVRPAGSQGSVG